MDIEAKIEALRARKNKIQDLLAKREEGEAATETGYEAMFAQARERARINEEIAKKLDQEAKEKAPESGIGKEENIDELISQTKKTLGEKMAALSAEEDEGKKNGIKQEIIELRTYGRYLDKVKNGGKAELKIGDRGPKSQDADKEKREGLLKELLGGLEDRKNDLEQEEKGLEIAEKIADREALLRDVENLLREKIEDRSMVQLESLKREAQIFLERNLNGDISTQLNDFIDEVDEEISKLNEEIQSMKPDILATANSPVHFSTDITEEEENDRRDREDQVRAINEIQKTIWSRKPARVETPEEKTVPSEAPPVTHQPSEAPVIMDIKNEYELTTKKGKFRIKVKGVAPDKLKTTRQELRTRFASKEENKKTNARLREIIEAITYEIRTRSDERVLPAIERSLNQIDRSINKYSEKDLLIKKSRLEEQLKYRGLETRPDLKQRIVDHLGTISAKLQEIEERKQARSAPEIKTPEPEAKAGGWTPEKETKYQRLSQILTDASERLRKNSEKLQKILGAREISAREKAREVEFLSIKFLEGKIRQILASFDAVKSVGNLSIAGSGNTLIFNGTITAKKLFITTEVTLKDAKLVNEAGTVKVSSYSMTATTAEDMVRDIIDQNISLIGAKLKEYIEKEKGKRVAKISIENGQLKVEYGNK